MRHILLLIAVGFSLAFPDCASTNRAARHQFIISLIKSWQFEYSSRVDQNATPTYQSQKAKTFGQMKGELQFPDFLFAHLKNRFNVPVTRDDVQTDGRMLVQAVTFSSGGFAFIDVALIDTKGLMLARTRIMNVDERNVVIHGDDFAEFAAEKIADLFGAK